MAEPQKMKRRKRTTIVLIVLGALILCVVLSIRSPINFVLDALIDPDPFDDRSFNQKVWLDHYEDWGIGNPRGRMAYSVQKLLLDSRMTREEVIELLGPPEYGSEDSNFQYLLGPWSAFRMDYDLLIITFDEDDRVKDVRIIPT